MRSGSERTETTAARVVIMIEVKRISIAFGLGTDRYSYGKV